MKPQCTARSRGWLWMASLVVAMACASAVRAVEPPLMLHPDNPHYFLWRGEPTLLITSGEHYGALLNLDFDYVRYFDALADDKLNHTRVFSGTYRETPDSFGITDNTLAPLAQRYICPWARSEQPGYFDGGNKFDLDRWDEDYFRRLRDLLTQAGQRGIVVELTLFCPLYNDKLWAASPMHPANNVNGTPDCPRDEVLTLKHPKLLDVQLALTRKIVTELKEFDNLYYEVCNEPYFGGVTMPWQHRIIDEIVATENDLARPHLISLNIANGRQKVEDPHPAVSIFNFHYCVPPDTVAMNYGLNKVIGENETGFRGSADLTYRAEGWNFILAGGALYNNLDYSFTARHPDGTFTNYRSPGGGSPELRKQLRILRDFICSFDFLNMKPAPDILSVVTPAVEARALAEPGKAYAIYLHVSLPKEPQPKEYRESRTAELSVTLPAGDYRAEWVNTQTGHVDKLETWQHAGGAKALRSPAFLVDVALRVLAQ